MLTIGEFSKLTHVSARMLRHYDLRGLLRPALVGENGHRYYDRRQLTGLVRIESLKSYGFTLAEIKDLLPLCQAELAGDALGVRVLPGGRYAATVRTGPYETEKYAYEAMAAWLGSRPEYEICGPSIERYLKDENMVRDPEEVETGVLFQVRRK